MSEESDYCTRQTADEAKRHIIHSGSKTMPVWAATMLLQRERAPLKQRIQELEAELAALKDGVHIVVSAYECGILIPSAVKALADLAEKPYSHFDTYGEMEE